MKSNKKWFYGIYGIQYIWHGEWADPELIWHGKSFNYYVLENELWNIYVEECKEENKEADNDEFAIWVKKNASLVREELQYMKDYKMYYGVYC